MKERAKPCAALTAVGLLAVVIAALSCSDVLGLEQLSDADPCDACSAEECGESLSSCYQDDRCMASLSCLQQCAPDDACCPAGCAQEHPSAEALTVMGCVCQYCAGWCGTCATGSTDGGMSNSCAAGGADGVGGAGGHP